MLSLAARILPEDVAVLVPTAALTATLVLLTVLLTSRRKDPKPIDAPIKATELPNDNDASAAASWARRDARLKHCALKHEFPNDWKDMAPPRYSLQNLDLHLPEITGKEEIQLKTLIERVEDLAQLGNVRTDKSTMLRFLRAKKTLKAAEAYFRQSVAYRTELQLNLPLETWNLEAYERCLAPWVPRGGIVGLSYKNGMVGWERGSLGGGFPSLLKVLSIDHLKKLDALHMTRTLAACEEHAKLRSQPVDNCILVIDLHGSDKSWFNMKVLRAYAKIVQGRDMLMPCTLKHCFLIRAPKWFSRVWNFVAAMVLDPVTREKVQIVSGDEQSLALLQKYMPNEVIPGYVGGGLRTNGDPNCSMIIGSSSQEPVPQEAVDQFFRLLEQGRNQGQFVAEPPPPPRSACWFGCVRSCGDRGDPPSGSPSSTPLLPQPRT